MNLFSLIDANKFLDKQFIISASEVNQLLIDKQITLEELLFALLQPVSGLAIPPISNFYVGAIGVGDSGNIYIGVNMEFPDVPLNFSIHAEQFVVVNAFLHGEQAIKKLAVNAAPCGHCRQFLSELNGCDDIMFWFGKTREPKYLRDYLPERFGPEDLGCTDLLLKSIPPQKLSFTHEANDILEIRSNDFIFQSAVEAALGLAKRSYAPYTKSYAGAAVISLRRQFGAGAVIESAAYNPTLSPIHTAIIDLKIRYHSSIKGSDDNNSSNSLMKEPMTQAADTFQQNSTSSSDSCCLTKSNMFRNRNNATLDLSEICEIVLLELRDAPVKYSSVARALQATSMPNVVVTTLFLE
mmetsp:Transcript_24924/g.45048  ORF Transcript_24924/g.45048 Transcript_24924/m.45048 type:complete len:353 (-) Transcript_24924:161-1219(-)